MAFDRPGSTPSQPGTGDPGTLPSGRAQRRAWWALGFVLAGYLSVFAGVTIMNVALPAVQADLGLSDASRQWVITLYALCFGALMLPAGQVADTIGLRRTFALGMIGFAATSLLGGLAGSTAVLLTARAAQGAAGAMVAATGLALLSVLFPHGAARVRAFAVLGIVMGVGTAGSFILAGGLVDALSWRWCLLVNVPVAVLVVTGVWRTTSEQTPARRSPMDPAGAVVITAAIALLVTGLDRAGANGWTHPTAILLITASSALIGVFAVRMTRVRHPLIPPDLVADRVRAGALAAVFLVGVGMFPAMYFLTSYLDGVLHYSPFSTGLAFLPFGAAAILTSELLRRWGGRVRPNRLLGLGLLVTAAASGTLAVLDPTAGYTSVLAAMLLLGSGSTLVMVTGSDAATRRAGRHSGVAGALVNSGQQVGAALGTALLTAIATTSAAAHVPTTPGSAGEIERLLHGYAVGGAVCAAILTAAAVGLLLLPPSGAARRQHGQA